MPLISNRQINFQDYFTIRLISFFNFFIVLLFSTSINAHEIRPAIVDLNIQENNRYEIKIRLNIEALIAEIGAEHDDTSESANAGKYNILRSMPAVELTKEFAQFENTFLNGIYLNGNTERLKPVLFDIKIPAIGDIALARDTIITLNGHLPAGTKSISWRWNSSFGANALRVSGPDKAELYGVYLQQGKSSDPIQLNSQDNAQQSIAQVFSNYVIIGFEHIIPKGLDHILFVVGLFLLSMRLAPLLWQITSFTIAHSVTLALAILGIIQVPATIVEPLIALSIVYVCIENILSDKLSKWRPIVIFLFGLLHGLGFASVLTDIGLNNTYFVTGLISFNVGLELGQLSVIGLCFLLFGYWFKDKSWYRQRITIPASALIAAIAVYWFFERI